MKIEANDTSEKTPKSFALWTAAVLFIGLPGTLWASTDVPIQFSDGPVQLAGSLTLPESAGPHPAVVLIAGGQQIDRDCSVSGGRYKLFKIVAESLAGHGVASLRYDSPGVGGSTGDWNQRTLGDRADEITNAIQVLKRNTNIDSKRIGLLGISQGSDLAEQVGGSSSDVDFVVLLSPHAKPLREDFLTFRAYLLKEDGVVESKEAKAAWNNFYSQTVWPAVANGQTNWNQITEQAKGLAQKAYDKLPGPEQAKFKDVGAYFQSSVDGSYLDAIPKMIPNLRSALDFDPVQSCRLIHCPVLMISGEADFFSADLPRLIEAVRKSGNTNCVWRIVPKAGHTLDNPAVSDERPVPELLPTLTSWFGRVVNPSPILRR